MQRQNDCAQCGARIFNMHRCTKPTLRPTRESNLAGVALVRDALARARAEATPAVEQPTLFEPPR